MTTLNVSQLNHLKNSVFLDTAIKDKENKLSYLFTDPVKIIRMDHLKDISPAFEQIEHHLNKGFWLAGYLSYEAGYGFGSLKNIKMAKCKQPLIWLGVYEKPIVIQNFKTDYVYSPNIQLFSTLTFKEYSQSIKTIKYHLKQGDTYQVNFTYDINVIAESSPANLYAYLRSQQPTSYASFISTDDMEILSFSPELFFRRDHTQIWVKPMKGTAAKTDVSARLSKDIKNRAENLMIVDLLRNDLGRMAKAGGVKVLSLFDIESHATLHQMTSSIKAELKKDISYHQIFSSLFPSGSVTGAPKIRTMKIINNLEKGNRGVYCGAIGYISPNNKAVFNVPIRTLQRRTPEDHWQYRVGSGIVWDSTPKKEWDECKIKTKFLQSKISVNFKLVETIRWNHQQKRFDFQDDHIRRMNTSAKYFKIPILLKDINRFFKMIEIDLLNNNSSDLIIRVLLTQNGKLEWEKKPLFLNKCENFYANVSRIKLDSKNIFLYHKTTYRPWYNDAADKINEGKIWDVLFVNEKDELCEGSRANIFVQKGRDLYTPPPKCGLLPGILRKDLIRRNLCKERIIKLTDLKKADKIFCGNSVRGLQEVRLKYI